MSLPTTISLTARDPTRSTADSATASEPAPPPGSGIIPMTLPALLQNPRVKQLQQPKAKKERLPSAEALTGQGGKRKQRRVQNAQLAGNPHLTRPSRADFQPGPPPNLSTTFAPPPPSFPRSLYIPPSEPSVSTPSSHGQFSMSLRGARKAVRAMMGGGGRNGKGDGGRVEEVLDIMESELRGWLAKSGRIEEDYYHATPSGGVGRVLDPTPIDEGQWSSTAASSLPDLPYSTASSASASSAPPPTLTELSRTPSALIWLLPSPHTRYLAHLLSRYYSLQSFSRPLSPLEPTIRVTHISRPNLVRPLAHIGAGLGGLGVDTPPGTDWSDVGATTGGEATTSGSEMDSRRRRSGGGVLGASGGETTGTDTDTDFDSEVEAGAAGWEAIPRGRRPLQLGEEVVLVSGGQWVPSDLESEEGGTGDEASSFGEDEDEDDTGVQSLASSFADLRPAQEEESDIEVDSGANVDSTPRRTSLPFTSLPSDSGTSTPRPLPLRARLPRESFPPPSAASSPAPAFSPVPSTPTPNHAATPTPTRASAVNRDVSTDSESSRSRSPTRARLVLEERGSAMAAGRKMEWTMPERTFGEWLFT
ncbi:hypothetical protein BCR35DRAFT_305470 [Leucosporidium creatinivorum]|uniref:Uncharacterized protein n=1 Tax=Leucosporidium creatinivorum TaxID=106004 RepID=A0A1Y2F039_9BASI|nr:hypothetical protein BCR35DRAFT_305470 [Leucosporidium creatinivorum]